MRISDWSSDVCSSDLKLSTLLASPDQRDFYRQLSSHWSAPEALVRDASEASTPLTTPGALPHTDSFEHDMMAASAAMYMPDDILVQVDRAAMAHSLEVRVPKIGRASGRERVCQTV